MNLASLPMYDLPELADATSAWWSGLASHMRREGLNDVPDTMMRPDDLHQHWLARNLLFSQTCGFPLTHALRTRVQLVGLPVYACEGCDPDGFYSSMIIVPASSNIYSLVDCRRARAVYNTSDSMSGLLALRMAASEASRKSTGPSFTSVSMSGGHRASIQHVADGRADIACIDAVTFALLSRLDPGLVSGVRVLGQTRKVPGLPYITSLLTTSDEVQRLRSALRNAVEDSALAGARAELLISGATFPNISNYDIILELEAAASHIKLP